MQNATACKDGTGIARRVLSAVLLACALFTATLGPAAASVDCGALPQAPWWKLNTYEAVVEHVNSDLGGDWFRYLAKWHRYAERMKAIYQRGGNAEVRSIGKQLRGAELERHINQIEAKIAVLTCLAKRENETEVGARLNAVDISAKGSSEAPAIDGNAAADHLSRTSFSISSPGRRLEITSVCRGPSAVFTVRNLENRANDVGRFTVLGGDGETVLTTRRLRLSGGQSVRFTISTARLEPFGGRAIFRVAMVAANPTTFDTDIVCA